MFSRIKRVFLSEPEAYIEVLDEWDEVLSEGATTEKNRCLAPFIFDDSITFVATANMDQVVEEYQKNLGDRLTLIPLKTSIHENTIKSEMKTILLSEKNYILKWALEGLRNTAETYEPVRLMREDYIKSLGGGYIADVISS